MDRRRSGQEDRGRQGKMAMERGSDSDVNVNSFEEKFYRQQADYKQNKKF